MVAFLGAGDSHQTLVAVLLWLVDFNNTSTEVSDLIDLSTSLSDNSPDHIVRDVNLLSEWLARHSAANRSCRGRTTSWLRWLRCAVRSRLVWTSTSIWSLGGAIGHWLLGHRSRSVLSMKVRNTIGSSTCSVLVGMVTLKCIRMAVLATSRLGHVRNNLHPTWNSSGRTAAPSRICGGRWSAKSFCKLLNEGHSNIVSSNVDSIGNTENNKRTLSGKGKAGVRGVETGSRSLLNFPDTTTTFTND